MKIMKRILSVALATSFVLGVSYAMPIYAAGTLPVLTVEEAARRAIRNNTDIANAQDRESVADEAVRRAQNAVWDAVTDWALTDANVSLMNAELSRSLNIRDIQARKENVEFQITRYFNTILNMQADLELAKSNRGMANRELEIARLRLSLGIASELDYADASLAVTRLETNIERLEIAIGNAFRDLNSAMGEGVNTLDRRHTLVLELNYEPVRVTNINSHRQRFVNESIVVARAENAVQMASYRANYFSTPHDPLTGIVMTNLSTYEELRVSENEAVRGVADARQSVGENVITMYNNLRNIELGIRAAEIEIDRLMRQLEVSETMLELGRGAAIEVERLRLEIAGRDNSLQQDKNDHAILSIAFNNPSIMMGTPQDSARQ